MFNGNEYLEEISQLSGEHQYQLQTFRAAVGNGKLRLMLLFRIFRMLAGLIVAIVCVSRIDKEMFANVIDTENIVCIVLAIGGAFIFLEGLFGALPLLAIKEVYAIKAYLVQVVVVNKERKYQMAYFDFMSGEYKTQWLKPTLMTGLKRRGKADGELYDVVAGSNGSKVKLLYFNY